MSDEHQSSSSSSSPNSKTSTLVHSPHSQSSQSSSSHTLTPNPKNASPSSQSSTPQSSLDEAATLRRSPYISPPHLPTPAEIAFDEMYQQYLADGERKKQKVPFTPVQYSSDEPPQKFRRLIARSHEKDLKEKLIEKGLSEYKANEYARNAAYCPGLEGSKHQPVDRAFGYEWSSRISLTSSEGDGSPKYLFKDLPPESPKKKIISLETVTESTLTTPERSPSALVTPQTPTRKTIADSGQKTPLTPVMNVVTTPARSPSVVVTPQTPTRKTIADSGQKTPVTPVMNVDVVDNLSPVFDRMKLRRNRKYSKNKTFQLSVLPSYKAGVDIPVGIFWPLNRTAEDVVVPSIQNSPDIPDKEIDTQKFQSPDIPRGHSDQEIPTEPLSSSLLSSKKSITTRESSYIPSSSIIILAHDSVTLKYPETLEQFTTMFNIVIVEGPFNERVTHVIVDEDDINIYLQYIQAIGLGKYLVNLSWIKDCITAEKLIDPTDYETVISSAVSEDPPSRKSRNSFGKLFEDFAILLADPFVHKINRFQLFELLVTNEATIMFEPKDFENNKDKIRICIVGELEFYNVEENKKQLRRKLEKYNCVKVNYNWIFDVFASYTLQPLTEYLFDSTVEEARLAGVPEELLDVGEISFL